MACHLFHISHWCIPFHPLAVYFQSLHVACLSLSLLPHTATVAMRIDFKASKGAVCAQRSFVLCQLHGNLDAAQERRELDAFGSTCAQPVSVVAVAGDEQDCHCQPLWPSSPLTQSVPAGPGVRCDSGRVI